MKKYYVYVFVKNDSSKAIQNSEARFKIGFTSNLDETVDHYESFFKFRKDRSFVFEGEFTEIKNLETILITLLYKFNLNLSSYDDDKKNFFNIKGLKILNEFSENLSLYNIKTKRLSLRKILEFCMPSNKILSRRNKVELLFDFNSLDKNLLENKYKVNYNDLKVIYDKFYKDMYIEHKNEFKMFLKMKKISRNMKQDYLDMEIKSEQFKEILINKI